MRASIAGEVRFTPGDRALYAYDASIFRQLPIGVVIPRDADDVAKALEVCRRFDAPVFGRGCGTSLAGQTVNAAVVFDFSKYLNQIRSLDPRASRRASSPASSATSCATPPRSTASPSDPIRPPTTTRRSAG